MSACTQDRPNVEAYGGHLMQARGHYNAEGELREKRVCAWCGKETHIRISAWTNPNNSKYAKKKRRRRS